MSALSHCQRSWWLTGIPATRLIATLTGTRLLASKAKRAYCTADARLLLGCVLPPAQPCLGRGRGDHPDGDWDVESWVADRGLGMGAEAPEDVYKMPSSRPTWEMAFAIVHHRIFIHRTQ